MIKFIKSVALITLIVSCNSNSKNADASYSVTKETATPRDALLKQSITNGKDIYDNFCINCHMANGKGVQNVFPPLADSDFLRNYQIKSIKAVKNGMSGKIVVNGTTYNSVMAPLGLTNKEVADVVNYINNSWGNTIDNFVTEEKVSKL